MQGALRCRTIDTCDRVAVLAARWTSGRLNVEPRPCGSSGDSESVIHHLHVRLCALFSGCNSIADVLIDGYAQELAASTGLSPIS